MEFNIKVYRATQNFDKNEEFIRGHTEVLKHFGITKITSANKDWFEDPNTYVIYAETKDTNKMIAGIRVQVQGNTLRLPIESAVGYRDDRIYKLLEDHGRKGTGELCGLWNSREVKGVGTSSVLLRAGVTILDQLNLKTLFGLCDVSRLKVMQDYCGYEIEDSLGNDGTFYYPKEDLLAVAIIIRDSSILRTAKTENKSKIFSLREDPVQSRFENEKKGDIFLDYDLDLSSVLSLT